MENHRLASVATVRAFEAQTRTSLPDGELMRRAGAAAARRIADCLKSAGYSAGHIVVLVGPGDNGGDGRIAADALRNRGYTVDEISGNDSRSLPSVVDHIAIVDALFGIGLTRPIVGEWMRAVEWINGAPERIIRIALDVPSGLNADTGSIVGSVAVRADLTVTFLTDKPGLHTGRGRDLAGTVVVETLGAEPTMGAGFELKTGLPSQAADTMSPRDGLLCNPTHARHLARPLRRRSDTHKGDFGTAVIVGGSPGMAGAVVLAGRAALLCGAGRVVLGFPGGAPIALDPNYPELMLREASAALHQAGTVVIGIGPGLGTDSTARDALKLALERSTRAGEPLVIDADALTLIASEPTLSEALSQRGLMHPNCSAILTPHPLEASRLLGEVTVEEVQRDRIGYACRIARERHCIVVLKGAGTVIAASDGSWSIAPVGNPALATGGTGDVLTGWIVGLLAQAIRVGRPPIEAALLGVWCHGRGAEHWVEAGNQPSGMTTAELLPKMRAVLHGCINPVEHPLKEGR